MLTAAFGLTQILSLACIALAIWGLVDAALRKPDAFAAADRQTKQFWLLILGVAILVLVFFGVISFFGVPAVVAAIVYIVDVRPKVAEVSRGPRY
ncbi:DUF2516 family protein [Longivirga aurantiaca]|uniref:DUF2516 family protein n=1 Tax=Longivirga aurantiaca TaxID=1837743 RepID=A0ABW1SWV7_9ACTN